MSHVTEWNAKISNTFLGREDHGIPTASIQLSGASIGQSAGGFGWDFTIDGVPFPIAILDALNIASWEALLGTSCRVRSTMTRVVSIGHITDDKWLTFEQGEDR